MIVVVADDFSGGAELGGVALRFGQSVEIVTEMETPPESDVLIIDTNTRSKTASEARQVLHYLARKLEPLEARIIYKKTDSVMRGHVLDEVEILLADLGYKRALLVPANPSAGRTIRHGEYFIDGTPLHRTDFARDPEFPVSSSKVLELLGQSEKFPTGYLKRHDPVPEEGVFVCETDRPQDLDHWVNFLSSATLPAGGSEFFSALMNRETHGWRPTRRLGPEPESKTRLVVSGSSSGTSRSFLKRLSEQGVAISELPCKLTELDFSNGCFAVWARRATEVLHRHNMAVIAVNQPTQRDVKISQLLPEYLARLVQEIVTQIAVEEIFIEGGSTASAIVRRLGWTRFQPIHELAPGVIRLKVSDHPNVYLTVKPGSYPWPADIFSELIDQK